MTTPSIVEDIFLKALQKKTPDERAAYLDDACKDDPDLRGRVERLLQAHSGAAGFLEGPVNPTSGETADFVPRVEHVGTVIAGRYKLLEQIGEGGMGTVWVAQQTEPVRRKVALKLIKPGMDSRSVLGRFEAERQALAVMDHPNIARVLDAGTTAEGRPYFVMDLVKGTPITEFCDARRLTPNQRLELFIPVCLAIQHAHMKGIIHRDIKPSNILVELHDEKAVAKVIDFGVAKAVGQQLTEKTIYTGFGALVGTPTYMAPEQATFNALDIDTRADVYALGVLLYELLAGSPPIEKDRLKKAALDEVLRIVRDEEPPRPSARLSTSQAKASIAATRQIEPAKLSEMMKGEIDWIVMKALEKDRTRRYESANSFAADVQRYLSGEQVQAVPPSFGYRMQKAYRRNRTAVQVASVFTLLLLTGFAVSSWLALRATLAESKMRDALEDAKKERDKAQHTLVQSYLRPIGYNTREIDQAEFIALEELASQEEDHIKLLFLSEALANGESALRIARRSERVVQATVGPSWKRRNAALELAKKSDKTIDPRIRLAATWIAIELGAQEIGLLDQYLEILLNEKGEVFADWLNDSLTELSRKLQPKDRARLFLSLLLFMGIQSGYGMMGEDATLGCLITLAPSVDPETASQGFETCLEFLRNKKEPTVLFSAGKVLAKLAPQIDSNQAKKGFADLIAIIRKSMHQNVWEAAEDTLCILASKVDDITAKHGFTTLLNVIGENPNAILLSSLSKIQAGLAHHLDSPAAKQGFDTWVKILVRKNDLSNTDHFQIGLNSLASQLNKPAAKHGFEMLMTDFAKKTSPLLIKPICSGLTGFASQLDPISTKDHIDRLLEVLSKSNDLSEIYAASAKLTALATLLDSATAKKGFDTLIGVLIKMKETAGSQETNVPGRATQKETFQAIRSCLKELAQHLDLAAVKLSFDTVIGLINSKGDLDVAGSSLMALVPRLQDHDVKQSFEALVGSISQTTKFYNLQAIGKSLASLAPHLDTESANKEFDDLVVVFANTTDDVVLQAVGMGLTALAPRIRAASANKGFNTMAGVLRNPIKREPYNGDGTREYWFSEDGQPSYFKTVAAIVPQLDEISVRNGFNLLIRLMMEYSNDTISIFAKYGLEELALRIDPDTAKRGFNDLVEAFNKEENSRALWLIADVMPRLIARMSGSNQNSQAIVALNLLASKNLIGNNYGFTETQLLKLIDNIEELTNFLRDPVFIPFQDAVLSRLEELAYPDPVPAVQIVGLSATPISLMMAPALQIATDKEREYNRRFRTVADASRWLHEHHPEIDLDRPYRKN